MHLSLKLTVAIGTLQCLFILGYAQTRSVTVEEGYGSGRYAAGDTIHIYAREEKPVEAFDHWSGDTMWLENPGEWHSKVLVPNKDIHVKANFIKVPSGAQLQFERLQGDDTLKPVLYYFPTDANATKALVWIFHGTGGNYLTIPDQVDGYLLIKRLIANGYAVAVSECDEATFKTDFSGDGNIRWNYAAIKDSNPDMTNHFLFMDYFTARAWMRPGLPVFGLGFSAGGSFSLANGPLMNFKKAASFCGVGTKRVGEFSLMPSFWTMGVNDNHPDVGREGNDTARMNYEKLLARGVCAEFNMFRPSPFYPEFFRRIPGIDSSRSSDIYNEMKFAGAIDNENYMKLFPDQLKEKVIANPALYPALTSLNLEQVDELDKQMIIMNAGHTVHSHYTGKVIKFFEEDCGGLGTADLDLKQEQTIRVYPNPSNDQLNLISPLMEGKDVQIQIYTLQGILVFQRSISEFPLKVSLSIHELQHGPYQVMLRDHSGNQQHVIIVKD